MSDETSPKVVPAQLNFLAIYNPSLAESEDNEGDQIVFYFSRQASERRRGKGKQLDAAANASQEENEHLRRVGLAQGMVNFAKTFSNGQSVDSVETEKHRIVLKELEAGWWILASIDLTILPKSKLRSGTTADGRDVEYSAREVSPPAVLLGQLLRAHRIFLIHNAASLSDLYVRTSRVKFCDLLDIFWTKFCRTWDVLLHGNPAVDIYNGIKLAAGGELGIGVGEEEWGSGEREVLEGLVRHTEGLVDLTVTRFGEPDLGNASAPAKLRDDSGANIEDSPWLGSRQLPGAADGLLFSGLGRITRSSLRDLCDWTQTIYTLGENSYGIKDSPGAGRRKRRQRDRQIDTNVAEANVAATSLGSETSTIPSEVSGNDGLAVEIKEEEPPEPTIPPPIVLADQESSTGPPASANEASQIERSDSKADSKATYALADPELWKTVFTLGYGTKWGKSTTAKGSRVRDESKIASSNESGAETDSNRLTEQPKSEQQDAHTESDDRSKGLRNAVHGGRFLIGLKGNLSESGPANEPQQSDAASVELDWNNRLSVRTLHLEAYDQVEEDEDEKPSRRAPSPASDETIKSTVAQRRTSTIRRLRVVVYVYQPFIFTLLFETNTSSLSYPSLFYELHRNLQPLHKPLLASTSPENVASRLNSALNLRSNFQDPSSRPPILDLIYDPTSLTVHTSIPNIPIPGTLAAEGLHGPDPGSAKDAPQQNWTRLAALNVHSHIINTYVDTRRQPGERERTAKTSRGWWVVWMRLPSTTTPGERSYKEAFLVRKSGEQSRQHGRSGRFGRDTAAGGLGRLVGVGGADDAAGWNPVRIAEGIGVDARRYVENLLSLSR